VQLSRLTAGHTPEELVDRASPANVELLQLLRGLAKGRHAAPRSV
jgi:hypothetical protein